eukprot:jgi/Mesvir1/23558/Mv18255-RA.1
MMLPLGGSSGRPGAAAAPVAGLTQRFQVDLRKSELVSYKKLVAEGSGGGASLSRAAGSASKDPLFGDLIPNDPLPPVRNQFHSVIERIERLYANPCGSDDEDASQNMHDDGSSDDGDDGDGSGSDEGGGGDKKKTTKKRRRAKDPKDDYYDTDDSFIDDEDLDAFMEARGAPQQESKSGFFINKGTMAENTSGVFLPTKAKGVPRKRVQAKGGKGDASSQPPSKAHKKTPGSGAGKAVGASGAKEGQQGKGKAVPSAAKKLAAGGGGKQKPAAGAAAGPASAATSSAAAKAQGAAAGGAEQGGASGAAGPVPGRPADAAGTGVAPTLGASTEGSPSKASKDIFVVAHDLLLKAIKALPPCTETNVSKISVPKDVRDLMELCVALLVKRDVKAADGPKMKQFKRALADTFGPLGYVDSKIQKMLQGHIEKAKTVMATLQADLDRAKETLRALAAASAGETVPPPQTSPSAAKPKFVWSAPAEDALHTAVSKFFEITAERRGSSDREFKAFLTQLCGMWPEGAMTVQALKSALEAAEKRLGSSKSGAGKINRLRQKLLGLPAAQPKPPPAPKGAAKKVTTAAAAKAAAATTASTTAAPQADGGRVDAPATDDDPDLVELPAQKKAKGPAGLATPKASHAAKSNTGASGSGKDPAPPGSAAGNVATCPVVAAAIPPPSSSPAGGATSAGVGPSPGKGGGKTKRITPVNVAAASPMPPAVLGTQPVPSSPALLANTNSNPARRLTPTMVSQPPP